MTGKAVLVLCIAAAFTSAYANICDGQNNDDLLPHADCAKFYQCSNGKPIEHHCSGVLVFNPKEQVCDYQENVQCGEGSGSDIASLALPDPVETCAAEGSHGKLLPHPNCDQFYECSFGRPFAFECPEGLLFSTVNERCEWASSVDCGERIRPSQNATLMARK